MPHRYKQFDPLVWLDNLLEVVETSKFSASERSLILKRLTELREELSKPIPFVEGR